MIRRQRLNPKRNRLGRRNTLRGCLGLTPVLCEWSLSELAGMLENFIILHASGECLFLKHCTLHLLALLRPPASFLPCGSSSVKLEADFEMYCMSLDGGDPLSLNLVMGVSSSLSTLLAVTKKRSHKHLTSDTSSSGGGSISKEPSTSSAASSSSASAAADIKADGGAALSQLSTNNALCSVTVGGLQLVYSETAPLTLVAQGSDVGGSGGAAYLGHFVRAVEELLVYYVGPFLAEPNHVSAIKGLLVCTLCCALLQMHVCCLCAAKQSNAMQCSIAQHSAGRLLGRSFAVRSTNCVVLRVVVVACVLVWT
jgi:hypothetical protein